MKRRMLVAGLAAALMCGQTVLGEGVGLTAEVGSLGFGGDITMGLGDRVNARVGVNWWSFDVDILMDEATVKGSVDLLTFPVLLDWHCFGGGFRVSAGPVINQNKITLSVTPDSILSLGDTDYTIQSLDGSITFDSVGGYLGIGYGNAVSADGHWFFACDFGVLYHGTPTVTATARAGDPLLQDLVNRDLQKEVADLQDDIDGLRYYPVISIGLSYRF